MKSLNQVYRSFISINNRLIHQHGRQLSRLGMYSPCRYCSSNSRNFENLDPFGTLHIAGNSKDLFQIQPLDPVEYPNQDRAEIKTTGKTTINENYISVDTRNEDSQFDSVLKVPLKFNIKAALEDSSSVIISSLESRAINVYTKGGDCELRKVKCDAIDIQAESGNVKCAPNLHSNGRICVDKGRIDIGRVIGDLLDLEGEQCVIDVKSSYVEQLGIFNSNGDVTIDSLHRTADIVVQNGNVNIGSLDGNVRVRISEGNLDLNVTQHVDIFIEIIKGDVDIKLPKNVDTSVYLLAPGVQIDDAFDCDQIQVTEKESGLTLLEGPLRGMEQGTENSRTKLKAVGDVKDIVDGEPGYIRISALDGNIRIGAMDWFSSLKLGNLEEN